MQAAVFPLPPRSVRSVHFVLILYVAYKHVGNRDGRNIPLGTAENEIFLILMGVNC